MRGKIINGDIFISVERVIENANTFGVDFENELDRVLIHGVLHLAGYQDKRKEEAVIMREKKIFTYLYEPNLLAYKDLRNV